MGSPWNAERNKLVEDGKENEIVEDKESSRRRMMRIIYLAYGIESESLTVAVVEAC